MSTYRGARFITSSYSIDDCVAVAHAYRGVPFLTSSHSTDDCVAVAHAYHDAPFLTSSRSQDDCVAVARVTGVTALADTKTGHAPVVEVGPEAWRAFLGHLKR